MNIGYPFRIDGSGRTAAESDQDHVRHLIEEVLFTAPGERVNRPDFGSRLMQFVFGAPNDELVAATQVLIQGSLQQWLGDLIEVEGVEVGGQENGLHITVRYTVRRTQEQHVDRFESQ
ncbi:MAG: GPW/gp25 family protein [Anaerolineae bacterium]|nr:MAG: GPW/gp25 family protein [Anaerolineae bacterium]